MTDARYIETDAGVLSVIESIMPDLDYKTTYGKISRPDKVRVSHILLVVDTDTGEIHGAAYYHHFPVDGICCIEYAVVKGRYTTKQLMSEIRKAVSSEFLVGRPHANMKYFYIRAGSPSLGAAVQCMPVRTLWCQAGKITFTSMRVTTGAADYIRALYLMYRCAWDYVNPWKEKALSDAVEQILFGRNIFTEEGAR